MPIDFSTFDGFRRLPSELTTATTHGATLTICAGITCFLLFLLELRGWLSSSIIKTTELDSHYEDSVWIDFHITMNALPCKYTKVKVRDVISHTELPILSQSIKKENLNLDGVKQGQHYDQEDEGQDEFEEDHPELDADWLSSSDEFKHTDFDAVIRYHDFTFINFYAEWCPHCRRFAPTWIEAENKADKTEYFDKNNEKVRTKLLRVNCVEFADVCHKIGIRGYPTVRMYKNDGKFSEYGGPRQVDALLKSVHDYIHERKVEHHSKHVYHHSEIGEGCRVSGKLNVRRVPGYFLLEADSNIDTLSAAMTNVSHTVRHIIFSDSEPDKYMDDINTYAKKLGRHLTTKVADNLQYLNSKQFYTEKAHQAPQHFMSVVKTRLDNDAIVYQTAVQSHLLDVDEDSIPQARFSYDFSPITIKFDTSGTSFYQFVTSIFALVGGTFTFISLIHRFVDSVDQRFKKRINKLG